MDYCAIIGDIVKSRELGNRVEVQKQFVGVVEHMVNDKYKEYIASRFTVTLGDEFQGLLYGKYSYLSCEIIKFISQNMKPVKLVYGVGIGGMDIQPDYSIAIRSDGPAYHNARSMVMRAKEKKPSICFCTGSAEDELINSLIYLMEVYKDKMTPKQNQAIELYNKKKSQCAVADELKVTQGSVSRLLNNAGYYEIKYAEKNIVDFLKRKYGGHNA
ncbi:MAG: SatD family protein [Clostridiales bacterium]|nr:SatD family protein [Clostridiales bacterium]HBM81631.1 hypothetical protein [Clostridiaceae bacterium]